MFWHKPKPELVLWTDRVDDKLRTHDKLLADIEGHLAQLETRTRRAEYRGKAQDLLAPHIAGSTMVAQQLMDRVYELLDAIKRLEV